MTPHAYIRRRTCCCHYHRIVVILASLRPMSAIDPLDLQLVLQLDPQAVLVDELASLPIWWSRGPMPQDLVVPCSATLLLLLIIDPPAPISDLSSSDFGQLDPLVGWLARSDSLQPPRYPTWQWWQQLHETHVGKEATIGVRINNGA
uniref:Uncharacterized protein n=1 Tax=Oryza sativa subsp. japonica TaxID=39947 RepID=Q6H4Q8_ORYSJ|nr:hypothetical protein [Oryza sativa Japonica Group]BAD26291.1 hypothetical protein [Oryza sativa Japonica Group]